MQQRQLFMLLGALGVVVLIAFLSGAFDNDFSEMDVPTFGIDTEAIEKIAITTDGDDSIIIEKQEDRWVVTAPVEAAADSIALTRLTENLGELKLESVVSSNPDRYENYGVTESAQQVIVTAGGSDQTLYIGNSGPDYRSLFLRMNDDPRVFVTNGRLNAPTGLDAWRDKTIMQLTSSNIERIQVTGPEESYAIYLASGDWMIDMNNTTVPADSAGVMRWLDRFSNLKGTGFDENTTPGVVTSGASHELVFTSRGGGAIRTLWLSDQENQLLGVTSEQQNSVFILSKGMLSSYVPESSTLTP